MAFTNDPNSLQDQLPVSIEIDKENFHQQFNQLYQRMTSSLNSKEGGLYVPEEKTTGQQYFIPNDPQKKRNVYRMLVDFGALPNNTTKTVAHNIDWESSYILTRSYGGATNQSALTALPMPNIGILLEINSTNVSITTTSDLSAYKTSYIVIEYLKE